MCSLIMVRAVSHLLSVSSQLHDSTLPSSLIMRLSYSLLVSVLAASVSADSHRLCCCAGFNSCNQFVCLGPETQKLVDDGKGRYIRSTKSWDKNTGSPCGGLTNWMYAADKAHGDDDHLGGDEVSKLCNAQGKSSRCFDPKSDYRNGYKIKGREVDFKIKPKKGGKKKKKGEEEEETWPTCP